MFHRRIPEPGDIERLGPKAISRVSGGAELVEKSSEVPTIPRDITGRLLYVATEKEKKESFFNKYVPELEAKLVGLGICSKIGRVAPEEVRCLCDVIPEKGHILYIKKVGPEYLISHDLISGATYHFPDEDREWTGRGRGRYSPDGKWVLASFSYGEMSSKEYLDLYTWNGEYVETLHVMDFSIQNRVQWDFCWLPNNWIVYTVPGMVPGWESDLPVGATEPVNHAIFQKFIPPPLNR